MVSIADNGIGIVASNQQSIFEKYQRISTTAEGHGVGIYLVKGMLERTGGKITVESRPESGSEFKIYLKRKDSSLLDVNPSSKGP